jgi:hypothetical protein
MVESSNQMLVSKILSELDLVHQTLQEATDDFQTAPEAKQLVWRSYAHTELAVVMIQLLLQGVLVDCASPRGQARTSRKTKRHKVSESRLLREAASLLGQAKVCIENGKYQDSLKIARDARDVLAESL